MSLRSIPSVDGILKTSTENIERYGRTLTTQAIRAVLEAIRAEVLAGNENFTELQLNDRVSALLTEWTELPIKTVINATGVIVHTNLGRSPLSGAAIKAMDDIAASYNTLEFNLNTGKRGHRDGHVENVLRLLTGAEAGFVVNNCASAVLLTLSALAKGKQVIIPRSQLVEIGGGFRVPDVMKQSGAKLLEVGTTNKVRISDYENAFTESKDPSKILSMRAHRSNFKIIGFTEEPSLEEIIKVTHEHSAIFIDDLGSGALIDTNKYGLSHEPMVQESVSAGADVVLFSGDKLIGGPQAGILVGKKAVIDKLRKHPLARAVRADKTTIAGIHATLLHYLKGDFEREIPIWRSISMPIHELEARSNRLIEQIGTGKLVEGRSTVGGGSLPGEEIPTVLIALEARKPEKFLRSLREQKIPIIARIEQDTILLDLRTIPGSMDDNVISILQKLKVNL